MTFKFEDLRYLKKCVYSSGVHEPSLNNFEIVEVGLKLSDRIYFSRLDLYLAPFSVRLRDLVNLGLKGMYRLYDQN